MLGSQKRGVRIGKSVKKIDSKTKEVLNTWSSIAKAALSEEFSSAKMSRAIKNNTLVNGCYYISSGEIAPHAIL